MKKKSLAFTYIHYQTRRRSQGAFQAFLVMEKKKKGLREMKRSIVINDNRLFFWFVVVGIELREHFVVPTKNGYGYGAPMLPKSLL